MQSVDVRRALVVPVAIVSVALVLGLWIHGTEMGNRGNEDSITVTGSAKRRVNADLAKWTATFSRRSGLYNLKEELARANADTVAIKQFITERGIPADAIVFTPIQSEPQFDYSKGGSPSPVGYQIRQEVRVESANIATIEALAQAASKLIDKGIVPEYQRTEFFYTKLAELRPELFAEATRDAKTRAEAIVSGTGNRVGTLKSAKTGVIQIVAPNSLEFSDWGAYDLSTKEKEINATVNVSFRLE